MLKKTTIVCLIFLVFTSLNVDAQQISGVVTDAQSGETIPYATVSYQEHQSGVISDLDGRYQIDVYEGSVLTFTAVGYKPFAVTVNSSTSKKMDIALEPENYLLSGVIVKSKRQRYSRKNNPAVELMRKVVAARKQTDLERYNFYQYIKYRKLTLAANDLTAEKLEKKPFKNRQWLIDQVETCQYNNKLILPVSVEETVSQIIYRREPRTEKSIILGQQSSGVNDLFQTGDIINITLNDVFTDVNLYEDQIRLLQYPFTSPIGKDAIAFYRYYIKDTVKIEGDSCIHLHFLPNNQQDFGFRGDLYILKDSSYHVRRCELTLPKQTGVNFVDNLRIEQEFTRLDNGEWVLTQDDMIAEMSFTKFLQQAIVIRTTRLSNYVFDEELPKQLYKGNRTELMDANAEMRGDDFWAQYRQVDLTVSENEMDKFVKNIQNIKGFKYFSIALKALIENSIETGSPNKVDLSPVNTLISTNKVDGLRTRLSARTTANLNKRWFWSGYYVHAWGSHRNYYNAEMTYSFIDKEYSTWEFPRRTLTIGSNYDVYSPSDRFLPTDKDNFLLAWKWADIDKLMICNRQQVAFDYETYGGLKMNLLVKAEEFEACGAMSFRHLSEPQLDNNRMKPHHEFIRTTELKAELRYAPGETYINTKQRRMTINLDAPVFTISHTVGMKGVLGGQYTSNITEAKIYKRFWMKSWGKIDVRLKGGIQWNQVPYLLLIMPMANQSYVIEDEMFNLVNNMEFLNDRYVSLLVSWDMNGKLLNRLPLIKRLKCREYFAVNMLWGGLSDKNNPFLPQNAGSDCLMYFPNGCHIMQSEKPYAEVVVGVHNIFKILRVEFVRRLSYLDLPTSKKWGIRYTFRMSF